MNNYFHSINSSFLLIIITTITFIMYLYIKKIFEKFVEVKIGILFVFNIYMLSIITIWALLSNMLLVLASVLFYINLIYIPVNAIVIKAQILILSMLILTMILDLLLFSQGKILLNKYIKDRNNITDKYVSFLVKVMTALTLMVTGLYNMFTDSHMLGFIISTFSITTVVLSFVELYRIIKSQEWK
jgi:hypothetical protein